MATRTLLRPALRLSSHHPLTPIHNQTRTFLPFPTPFTSPSPSQPPQTLTATRNLPYAHAPIYSIIADVSSYASFLPYCESSTVTSWSAPDPTYSRRWPSEGRLTVGFKGLSEEFTSRVYCIPGRVVESVGGTTSTSLPADEIRHHGTEGAQAKGEEGGLLTHLRSRWSITPLAEEKTQVSLALEFAFANPIYTALSAGVAPKVAELMVKAFEERVHLLLMVNPQMQRAGLGELEGSAIKRR